jgi:hypothetical protein
MIRRFATYAAALAFACGIPGSVLAQASPRKLVPVTAPGHDPLFVDAASVQRRSSFVSFKYVLDVRAPPDDRQSIAPWRSNEIEATIDCAKKTVSVRRLTAYPGPGGAGTPTAVHSFAAADVKPQPIAPKSTFAYLEEHVCRAG